MSTHQPKRLSFMAPSGGEQTPREFDIDLTAAERQRILVRLVGIPVSGPGRHTFRVELQEDPDTEWRLVASVPITIDFVEVPPMPETAATDEGGDRTVSG